MSFRYEVLARCFIGGVPREPGQHDVVTYDKKLAKCPKHLRLMGDGELSVGERVDIANADSKQPAIEEPTEVVFTSETAKQLALQEGIDPATITGTGKEGAVKVDDVKAAIVARDDAANAVVDDDARALAEEQELDLSKVTGTGEEGRITLEDVQLALAE